MIASPDEEAHEYFAYGTNLDAQRMRTRCPGAHDRRAATLDGHRLLFNKLSLERDGFGYANAEAAPGVIVEGALYTMTKADLLRLDRFEGYPTHYTRRLLAVCTASGERVPAWVYTATPEWRGDPALPAHPDHLKHMLAGRDLWSAKYLEHVQALAGP